MYKSTPFTNTFYYPRKSLPADSLSHEKTLIIRKNLDNNEIYSPIMEYLCFWNVKCFLGYLIFSHTLFLWTFAPYKNKSRGIFISLTDSHVPSCASLSFPSFFAITKWTFHQNLSSVHELLQPKYQEYV